MKPNKPKMANTMTPKTLKIPAKIFLIFLHFNPLICRQSEEASFPQVWALVVLLQMALRYSPMDQTWSEERIATRLFLLRHIMIWDLSNFTTALLKESWTTF